MSQQSKCDRCGVVGDAVSGSFGVNTMPSGWAKLQVWTDMMETSLDLCAKCFDETIAGAGLEIPMKKAEAAHLAYAGDMIGSVGPFPRPPHMHGPHGVHMHRRPPGKPPLR